MYCVYFLRCPITGEAKYVGITSKPKTRLYNHIRDARLIKPNRGSKKEQWIRSILDQGLQPVMHVVFYGLTKEQACRVEGRIIRGHANSGIPLLQQKRTARCDSIVSTDVGAALMRYVLVTKRIVEQYGVGDEVEQAVSNLRRLGVNINLSAQIAH